MSIDWNKPLITHDGARARFIGRLQHPAPNEPCTVVCELDGRFITFTEDGRYLRDRESMCDLRNEPERIDRFINLYGADKNVGSAYWSREEADRCAHPHQRRTGVLRIRYEDGRPVESLINYPD